MLSLPESRQEMPMTCVRRAALRHVAAALISAGIATAAAAQQPASSAAAPTDPVRVIARNWTRVEMWRFFEPNAGGGDPRYAHVANRLQFGVERRTRRYELIAALQYVQFGGLPADASGPGPLGTGSLYFDQGGGSNSSHLYLRYLNLKLDGLARGWSIRIGRMGYTSGAEAPSGDPKIEAVKRQRVDSRLIGEFEWSLYQRGFDGVRTDVDRPGWHASAALMRPTQGGFEDAAGRHIADIDIWAATATARPGRLLPHTDVQLFAMRYDDDREVRQRPDNTGVPASTVDVDVATFGGTLTGAYPLASARQIDLLLWAAGQTGRWFGDAHRASAVAFEGGLQWGGVPAKPWLRGGYARAAGDDDAADGRHGTFFPMLPTARKYALSAAYSLMNLEDVFVQLFAAPTPALSLRVDVHQLALAEAADRWYFGSGAGQASGAVFGYGSRPSQGATRFGTVVETAVDYRLSPRWSVNGYLGVIRGADVVERTFQGRRLIFGYVENVVQF
jgi:hypothetical protein